MREKEKEKEREAGRRRRECKSDFSVTWKHVRGGLSSHAGNRNVERKRGRSHHGMITAIEPLAIRRHILTQHVGRQIEKLHNHLDLGLLTTTRGGFVVI